MVYTVNNEKEEKSGGLLGKLVLLAAVILFVVVGYWVLGAVWSLFTSFFLPIVIGFIAYHVGKGRGIKQGKRELKKDFS